MYERIAYDARYVNDRYHGIGRYAFRLLQALVETATDRTFIVLRGQAPDSRFNWDALKACSNVIVESGPAPLYWPHEQLQWPWLLHRLQADLFHSPYFVAPLLTPQPAILTVHDLIFERYPAYLPQLRPYYRLLMKTGMRRACRVIAVSQSTARDLQQFYSVPSSKISVIAEAADPALKPIAEGARLSQLRQCYGLTRPFILSVGARRPHKNLGCLIRAYARLASDIYHDLVFVGPADHRFPDEACQAAQCLLLTDRVHFLGWVPEEDLAGLYTLADVVVVPSLIEGFGLPVLEAMACGAPVLVNNAASLPEVAGDAALLVNAADEDALAQGLRRLLTEAGLRQSLSAAGLRRAAEFTWQLAARDVLAVYKEIESQR
jgi:glycosyltransferase involved in cell wall biosynthesis